MADARTGPDFVAETNAIMGLIEMSMAIRSAGTVIDAVEVNGGVLTLGVATTCGATVRVADEIREALLAAYERGRRE